MPDRSTPGAGARGITGYSTYVPKYRLSRSEIAAAVGSVGRGSRSVASYDEDTTSMGVEAGRRVLTTVGYRPTTLWFATSAPAYADKVNATAIHAALGLDSDVGSYDLGANVRSGAAALLAAHRDGGVAVLSDIRGGRVGSPDESAGGDAASAFTFGDEGLIAELLGSASVTEEFLDRWRIPGNAGSTTWEERFGEGEYVRIAESVVTDVLKSAGLSEGEVSAYAVVGPNARAVRSVSAAMGRRTAAPAPHTDLASELGNAGAAQIGLATADLLDRAQPDEVILVVSVADGADAFLWRTTDLVASPRRHRPVREAIGGGMPVAYPTYLLWRGLVERDAPRRPDPVRPSAPFAARDARYKFAFAGGKCTECGTVQFPLPRICLKCRAADSFDLVSAAGSRATVATYTVDRLAFTPSPPLISAVLDLAEGGRVQCELTDVDPARVAVGDTVELTFRRLLTAEGIHNYFWKAAPILSESSADLSERG